jgi:hypothetical protein
MARLNASRDVQDPEKSEVDVGLATFPNWDRDDVAGEDWEDLQAVDTQWERRKAELDLSGRGERVEVGHSTVSGASSLTERIEAHCARAALMGAAADLTPDQWRTVYELFRGECAYCGRAGRVAVEHVVPVYLGGGTTQNNVVPACKRCNLDKGRMAPELFFALYPKRESEFTARVAIANGWAQ